MTEIVEGEIVDEPGTELVHVPAPASPTLFGTNDPAAVIVKATAAAEPLAQVVRKQKLTTTISGREHVRVEGWTLLGSMLGVFPVCVWTHKVEDGWEARVEARTRDGAIVGAAEAQCLRSESTWKSRDDYALRSMAQTRATSKALRQPLGFVMQLAGFDATPAEEMPHQPEQERSREGAYGFEQSRADATVTTGNPADVVIHFGKNQGTRLGDLTAKQLSWYAETWTPKPEYANEQDYALQAAARKIVSGGASSDTDPIPF